MKRLFIILSAITLVFSNFSCSSSNSDGSESTANASSKETDPVDYERGPEQITAGQLDQLILSPDDLTPGQAAGALKMLSTIIGQTSGTPREETMRKFVDLYGIMLDIHGDNMYEAFDKMKRTFGVDIQNLYADYSTTLKVGDDTGAGDPEEAQESEETTITTAGDSTATSTDVTTINDETGASITTVGN
ncbi:MAG: hypothetical protein NC111_03490 [Bacteroides sp.]|nr:hypothetical protein [Bacteroides sp.]MCM1412908.1 hypothetical protein [Bacteroides sp.]MCM1471577.1 hypothetical protein [Bacteroides sp.]